MGTIRVLKVPKVTDKKVRIDDYLLKLIKKLRNNSKNNSIKYPSDKYFVQRAILDLLEKEGVTS